MDKLELLDKTLDYLHQLCDEYEHEIDEADMDELEILMDKLENIREGWFDEDSE